MPNKASQFASKLAGLVNSPLLAGVNYMSMSIEEFIKQADIHALVEYGNRASVRKGNAAADKMNQIANHYADAKKADELLGIINHEAAGSWVAFSLANNSNLSPEQKKICISKIQSLAASSGVKAIGAQMWLKEHGYENS